MSFKSKVFGKAKDVGQKISEPYNKAARIVLPVAGGILGTLFGQPAAGAGLGTATASGIAFATTSGNKAKKQEAAATTLKTGAGITAAFGIAQLLGLGKSSTPAASSQEQSGKVWNPATGQYENKSTDPVSGPAAGEKFDDFLMRSGSQLYLDGKAKASAAKEDLLKREADLLRGGDQGSTMSAGAAPSGKALLYAGGAIIAVLGAVALSRRSKAA